MQGTPEEFKNWLRALQTRGWYPDEAPVLDGVLSGPAENLSFIYQQIGYVAQQARIATASDVFLDMISEEFLGRRVPRKPGETDSSFRTRILRELLKEKGTRKAVRDTLLTLTGSEPLIIEPMLPMDTGAYTAGHALTPDRRGTYTTARASTGTFVDASGTLQVAAPGVPRVTYDMSGNYIGVLDEPVSTNFQIWSGYMLLGANAGYPYSLGANSTDGGFVAAPDGTTSARRITSTGGGNNFLARRGVLTGVQPGTLYTVSVFLRRNAGSNPTTGSCLIVDEFNGLGTSSRTGSLGFSTTSVGTAWQRYSRSFYTKSDTETMQVYLAGDWDAGLALDIWGLQIEMGNLTSYIPTTFEAATRQADNLQVEPVYLGGYDSAGSYATLTENHQAFITVKRPGNSGIPTVQGYAELPVTAATGGYDVGAMMYGDLSMITPEISDSDIYAAIADVIPMGTTAWVKIIP